MPPSVAAFHTAPHGRRRTSSSSPVRDRPAPASASSTHRRRSISSAIRTDLTTDGGGRSAAIPAGSQAHWSMMTRWHPASRRCPPEGRDPKTAELLEALSGFNGTELNIFATLAHHPRLLKRWSAFGGVLLYGGALPARERELLILRTGYLCRAPYEWGQHVDDRARRRPHRRGDRSRGGRPRRRRLVRRRRRSCSAPPTSCTPTAASATTPGPRSRRGGTSSSSSRCAWSSASTTWSP